MYDIHDKSTYDIFRTNHRAGNLSSETDFLLWEDRFPPLWMV